MKTNYTIAIFVVIKIFYLLQSHRALVAHILSWVVLSKIYKINPSTFITYFYFRNLGNRELGIALHTFHNLIKNNFITIVTTRDIFFKTNIICIINSSPVKTSLIVQITVRTSIHSLLPRNTNIPLVTFSDTISLLTMNTKTLGYLVHWIDIRCFLLVLWGSLVPKRLASFLIVGLYLFLFLSIVLHSSKSIVLENLGPP